MVDVVLNVVVQGFFQGRRVSFPSWIVSEMSKGGHGVVILRCHGKATPSAKEGGGIELGRREGAN